MFVCFYLKIHFSSRVCVSMLDCFLAIMLVWKATLDLPVSSIDLVSVDLPSKFEGSGLTIYLARLRTLEHWLVSGWCGCSKIFCFPRNYC